MARCTICFRTRTSCVRRSLSLAGMLLLGTLAAPASAAAPPAAPERIANLIQQLGSAEYAQREQARMALSEMGLEAFDALHQAQLHEDMEIRKQAEYLVRAIRVAWVQEDDPPAVKQILRNYQDESPEERELRLQRLARVPGGVALAPLCRLARFETFDPLSKRAALLAMSYPLPVSPADTADTAAWPARIDQVIGPSQRTAARWLRLYARYLEDPAATFAQWQTLADEETRELELRPDPIRLVLLREFLRWQVDMWERQGRRAEAIATMRRTLPPQNASLADLRETADWLLQREAWPLIEALAEQFPDAFAQDPSLIYRRAESLRRQNQPEAADELARQARETQVDDEPFLHVELGRQLVERGWIDWAEQEFRHTIKSFEAGSHASLEAHIRLGMLYHDLARHAEAYAVLKEVVDLMERNTTLVRRLQELQRDPNRVRGQMYFSRALDLHQQGQYEQEREALAQALRNDGINADILIAMFRVPAAPEDWQKQTRDQIDQLAGRFRAAILLAERNYEVVPNDDSRDQLALMLNQYAWLVANTQGDVQAALDSSRRSLELAPDDPGYLDTLARCYFAAGDLDNAIKHQRRAAEQEPHAGPIRRQLELFEKTLAEQRGAPHPPPPQK